MQIPWDPQERCSLEVMSPCYAQGEGVSRVHKVHIGHLLNLLFICMCNAGMCAYGGVCHAMSLLVGYVRIRGVGLGLWAYVGGCHAMSVFESSKMTCVIGWRVAGRFAVRIIESNSKSKRKSSGI